MDPKCASLLRQLPQVDDLLRHPELAPAVAPLPRLLAAAVVRRVLAAARQTITAGPPEALPLELDEAALLHNLREALLAAAKPMLRRVVNLTGVVIHTNLGRSPLGEACLASLLEVASRYNTLEYDLAQGARGSRQDHLEGVLKELTGADGVLVVNNCAAAVLPGPQHPGLGQGSGHFPGPTGGDRRLLPHARDHGGQRRHPPGSGHHQQDLPQGL